MNTGNSEIDSMSWSITAVIVDIDFTADFLLGLSDIRKIKLFRYLPECVEESDFPNSIHEIDQTAEKETIQHPDDFNGTTNDEIPVSYTGSIVKKSEEEEKMISESTDTLDKKMNREWKLKSISQT